MNSSTFAKLTAPLRRRIKLMVSRAVGRLVDPSTLLQTVQIELLKGELLDGIEHVEGYGRTAVPPKGWEGVAASLGGDRSHTVLLSAFHRTYRLKNLKPGEVALYDDLGNVIVFERDQVKVAAVQHIDVTAPTCHITATTTHDGNVTINGNLTVNGTSVVTGMSTLGGVAVTGGDVVADGISLKTHTHPGDSGGTTGAPQS